MSNEKLIIGPAPHLQDKDDTKKMMGLTTLALLPAIIAGIIFFGFPALKVIIVGMVSAMATEIIISAIFKKKITIGDRSSAGLTGLLLALICPPSLPWWTVAVGSFVAIAIAKLPFGGLGHNIFNPALVGRAFLVASWPVLMTTWQAPLDAITTATPLGLEPSTLNVTYWQLFLGNVSGSLGETSALAILIGGLYLIWRNIIDWRIPASYIGTVFIFTALFGRDPIFHILAGGLFLGAFFMATDPVTNPLTKKGRIIFGVGAGLIVGVIRLFGGYPEGVCYSILLMNAATPLIDRYARPRIYGTQRGGKK